MTSGPRIRSRFWSCVAKDLSTLSVPANAGFALTSICTHEACTITGPGDMWCRVVARSNTDLQRVIDAVLVIPGIFRSSTVIALATQVPYRVQPGLGV